MTAGCSPAGSSWTACPATSPMAFSPRGWQEIDGKRYYFGDDGKMQTSFTNIGGDIYYLDEGGQPLTGDVFIGENRYHFSDEGVMHTGWLTSEDGRATIRPTAPW